MAAKLPNMDGTFGILYVFLNSIEIMVYFTVFLFELPAEIATKLDRAPIITFFSLEEGSNFVQKPRQDGTFLKFRGESFFFTLPGDRLISLPPYLFSTSLRPFF